MNAAPGQPYGLLAIFAEPEPLIGAVRRLRQLGYRRMDAFTPFPVSELAEELGMKSDLVPWIVLAGGIFGGAIAYGLVVYSVEISYPINVGGRSLHSWPAFLVYAFEGGILGAAIAGFLGMLALNGLPAYYHPAFNAPSFSFEKSNRFFLLVEAADPNFRLAETRAVLQSLGAGAVEEVEP